MVTTKQLTASDLWNLPSDELHDYELIEGELTPMVPPGGEHGKVQLRIALKLQSFVDELASGTAFGEVGFVLDEKEHTVLAPDAAYVSAGRLPEDQRGFLHLAPDLAIEIISPSNSPGEIERKIAIYLRSGVRLIWVIYPDQQQIVAHAAGMAPRVFGFADTIPGDDVLPGLEIPVADIFS